MVTSADIRAKLATIDTSTVNLAQDLGDVVDELIHLGCDVIESLGVEGWNERDDAYMVVERWAERTARTIDRG